MTTLMKNTEGTQNSYLRGPYGKATMIPASCVTVAFSDNDPAQDMYQVTQKSTDHSEPRFAKNLV